MRCCLRLAEFRFEIHYKKGLLNTQADALSRLESTGHTTEHADIEIPCFTLSWDALNKEEEDDTVLGGESGEDFFPFEDEHFTWLDVMAGNLNEAVKLPNHVSIEEMLLEQESDSFCQRIRDALD